LTSNEAKNQGMSMKPSLALQTHRTDIRRVVEAHRANNARVFGSVAHGDDIDGSDLDLLIDPTPDTTLFDIGAIRHELRQLLGVPVDVLTPNALPEKFRARVIAEAIARLPDYLDYILQAIGRIRRYTDDLTDWAFLQNELVQDAVIRNFEIVGEASRNIERHYPEFVAAHPEVPLAFAYEMRNALAHGYFKVDLEIVWKTIQNDLTGLQNQVQNLVVALGDSGIAARS
ncbi:hypothetical protein DFQ30_008479, partial [Apophysomyces sp. BC1015]